MLSLQFVYSMYQVDLSTHALIWYLSRGQQQQFLKDCCLKWLNREKLLISVDESNETYLYEVNKLHLSLIDIKYLMNGLRKRLPYMIEFLPLIGLQCKLIHLWKCNCSK